MDAVAGANRRLSVPEHIPGESPVRSEVFQILLIKGLPDGVPLELQRVCSDSSDATGLLFVTTGCSSSEFTSFTGV